MATFQVVIALVGLCASVLQVGSMGQATAINPTGDGDWMLGIVSAACWAVEIGLMVGAH